MDKLTINSRISGAQVRIDQVACALKDELGYEKTSDKLLMISRLLDECKDELKSY